MLVRIHLALRTAAGLVLLFLVLLAVAASGCGGDNRSYYEKEKAGQDVGVNFLKERQVKLAQKHYPKYGSAWLIDMQGLPLDEAMLEQLKTVGYITELNFSKTGMNDQRMAIMQDRRISGFLLKLDLSHTAVTDAGLEHLKDVGPLSELILTGTKVTPAGIKSFLKARADDQRIPDNFKKPKIVL